MIPPPSSFFHYDAILLLSFGGPERSDDVVPFLENLLRGKNVPRERLEEVAEHYYMFGGASPINEQNRALLAALVDELNRHGPRLPVYWGNRNWHPFLADTLGEMADDGVRRALAFATSAFGSYSSCRQYLDDIEAGRQQVGPDAPQIDKIRLFYNHPGFVEAMADRVRAAIEQVPEERRQSTPLVYTAHSIPVAMAERAPYESQLKEACRLVSGQVGRSAWTLVYQSRSGPPSQPWLEPDVRPYLAELCSQGKLSEVVVAPIGFINEHMELLYDLDYEAGSVCEHFGVNMIRAGVVGTHPKFVTMIRQLVEERMSEHPVRLALGNQGPAPDGCAAGCCTSAPRP